MMLTALHANILMNVLDSVIQINSGRLELEKGRLQLQAIESQLSHERAMFGIRTSVVKDLISALLTQRVNAVQHGFDAVLAIYADQSRSYMDERQTLVLAQFKAANPIESAHIQARLSEIDMNLDKIRADAKKLYREMNRTILLIGGAMPIISAENMRALALPAH